MAVSTNNRVFYKSLAELDAAAQQLRRVLDGKNVRDFNPNNNLVVKIFSNDQRIETLKPKPKSKSSQNVRPVIIITAGSPGVGKSTITSKELIKYGVDDPDEVYTVSMDTLLERSHLFRERTLELYHSVRSIKKMQNGEELTNQNYATLSGVSATAYKSREDNFGSRHRTEAILDKYLGTTTNKKRTTHKKPAQRRLRSRSPQRQNSSSSTQRSRSRSRSRNRSEIIHNLEEIREIGFEFGVANGLNILFDCTLSHTGTRMNSIMTILQKYANAGPKYRIKVLLIKACDDIEDAEERIKDDDEKAATIIQTRIIGRHRKMVSNGYLRSLATGIRVIKSMIKQNREGYHTAKEKYYYKNGKINQSQVVYPPYSSSDFHFEEIVNKPH
jgi:hypothetical protein